ncbi:LPD29 domain-containing protein [Providencia heimbachae]|uniref:LPD29 domain-containing protein n=1 Tax=Providencia heimbachae TaxID=333962 RepID=UPI00223F4DA7|nr:LPD29 domain-containing protein [Providencia heimbachae]
MEQQTLLSVGQVVYTNLYNHGAGVISQIHGEQKPETVQNMCNVMVTGGNAEFDIVFYNGDKSNRLPESILRGGIQWKVKNELVDNDTINLLLKKAADCEQAKKNEENREKKEFNDGIEKQKQNKQYAHLTKITSSKDNEFKTTGKNIRAELKKHFPKNKFSVRMSDYNCYRVSWVDGKTVDEVDSILSKFKCGRFDAYTDYHYTEDSPFNVVYGGVQFLFTSRQYSDEAKQKTIETYLNTAPSDFDKSIVTLENLKNGYLNQVGLEFSVVGVGNVLYKLLRKPVLIYNKKNQ